MEHVLNFTLWEQYSDEADHYSYVRCLNLGTLYEVIRVTHDKHGDQAEFVHRVIFMAEYDEQALTAILQNFGYESLDAFVREVNHADVDPAGLIVRSDGSIDREASPSWWIDYMLLASLMSEHFDGLRMAAQTADALAKAAMKADNVPSSSFCIQRTFADELLTIPLTETEIEEIYSAKAEQARMENLCDELNDLDEDDSCFEGHSQEALLNDKEFLEAVLHRWYRYNGHGGDQVENLREAIKVTIHELYPA